MVRDTGTITASYNTGTVTGTSVDIGGVVGRNRHSAIVTACYNTGDVSGPDRVGGVAGYNYTESTGTPTLIACYNTGNVLGSSAAIGGVVGNNGNGAVTASYWQTGGGRIAVGIGDNGTGSGIPTPFDRFFTPSGDPAWNTESDSPGTTNQYWKAGVNYATQLPKLWFE